MVEVCAKILYQVELSRNNLEQMWGFSVEAELIENADHQDELCCYVSRVEDKSVAMQNGNYFHQVFFGMISLYTFCFLPHTLKNKIIKSFSKIPFSNEKSDTLGLKHTIDLMYVERHVHVYVERHVMYGTLKYEKHNSKSICMGFGLLSYRFLFN